MKRFLSLKWCLIGLAGFVVLMVNLCVLGWQPWADTSIVVSEGSAGYNRGKVENGSAYDRAAVDIGACTKVVLPADAIVRRSAEPGKLGLLLRKTLGFGGHAPESMSIRGARKNMGAAVRVEQNSLIVATFGE